MPRYRVTRRVELRYNPAVSVALNILDPAPARPEFAQGPRRLSAVRLLRLSVTDRCNFRCVYCMPEDGVAFYDRTDLLSPDEIVEVARAARRAGVTHFKVTGGEPTVRGDLLEIIEKLAALDPADLSMTTNGMLLTSLAQPLRDAGLDRLTVSLDSLRQDRFHRITGGRLPAQALQQVWDGLAAAEAAGFTRMKINVVVMRGVNDDEAPAFAALTRDRPWTVRFIEYMPLGQSVMTQLPEGAVPSDELKRRIAAQHGPLAPVDRQSEPGVGPAEVFSLPGASGRVGFISAMSHPFCETCNRLRLTARGELRACLFDGGEVDVLPALRPVPDGDRILEAMHRCVAMKPQTHGERGDRAMSQMGG